MGSSKSEQPNFLIIVADDLGFTDLESFGGEINTPNLTRLSNLGVRFTDFHTASACSPTRSMLFSGTDNHIAGLGQMAEFSRNFPEKFGGKKGYEGYLNDRVAALPEILHDAGYYTFISGKWHLGLLPDYWPVKKGFERSFTLLPGAGNHYKFTPKDKTNGNPLKFMPWLYVEDDQQLDADSYFSDDFYSTDYYTSKGLEYLSDKAKRGNRPFFGCLTYTAPHWPYQAPADIVAKYKGIYDGGPEILRRNRLNKALEKGIIPEGVTPHEVETQRDKAWSELSEQEKLVESRIMETYAAMVEILDTNIGKVLDHLEKAGELDNTFILFMSDNGAEGMMMEALPLSVEKISDVVAKYYDNSYENIGKYNSFVWYSDQWAQAATAPSYMYKMWASEGGIRCPLILHYPPLFKNKNNEYNANVRSGGDIVGAFATVMDILPTVLDLAGVSHPGTSFRNREVVEPRGKSWVNYLLSKNSSNIHSEDTVTGWELFGQQAIRKGSFKALFIPRPFGTGEWKLFNIIEDPGETSDLSKSKKEILNQLLEYWAEYVAETGLIEFGDEFDEDRANYEKTILYQ